MTQDRRFDGGARARRQRGLGPRAARGFSLLEALVALLVMAFGMLAIAGMQAALMRSSDAAKQRSEAVRLAQLKLEELRSFDGISTGSYTFGTDVVASSDAVTPGASNTSFTRSWTVMRADGTTAATVDDSQKWISVTVDWADREGASQQTPVRLRSVIGRNDPIAIKGLVAEQARTRVRYPKNRNLNIPYPAVGTSNPNRSAFIPPPGNVTYIFDNVTGNIVQSCTGITSSELVEGVDVSAAGSCTTLATNAYLLSGFIRFFTGNNPGPDDIINTNGTTLDLATSGPLAIDASATGNGPSTHVCYAQRQKVVTASNLQAATITSLSRVGGTVTVTTSGNHGYSPGLRIAVTGTSNFLFEGSFEVLTVPTSTSLTYAQAGTDATASGGELELIQQLTLAETDTVPSGYGGQPQSTYVSYACIVTPVDDDGDTNTALAWWGKLSIVPGSGWSLGTTNTTYKVCRYSSDYDADGLIANIEHPKYYRRVTGALDNQNFVVIRGNETCPIDIAVNYSGSTVGSLFNTNTATHQTAATGDTAVLSFGCLSTSCSGANRTPEEPSTATTVIPME
jgi:type IV pilus modification protein PilV